VRNEIWIAELLVAGTHTKNKNRIFLLDKIKTKKNRPGKRDGLGALQLTAVDAKTGTNERRKSLDKQYLPVLKLPNETNSKTSSSRFAKTQRKYELDKQDAKNIFSLKIEQNLHNYSVIPPSFDY
jgi:hypothetical protein